jgi:hypothetical protein
MLRKYFISCTLLLCLIVCSEAQTNAEQGIQWSFGIGAFHLSEREDWTNLTWYWHHQTATNLYFGCDLFNNYYRTGAEVRFLRFWSELHPSQNLYMMGWYNQFNFIPKAKWGRLFIEVGLHQGNLYPTPQSYALEKVEGLFYLGFAYGMQVKISKYLDLSGSINFFPNLNNGPFTYNYGNYELGLEYRLR